MLFKEIVDGQRITTDTGPSQEHCYNEKRNKNEKCNKYNISHFYYVSRYHVQREM